MKSFWITENQDNNSNSNRKCICKQCNFKCMKGNYQHKTAQVTKLMYSNRDHAKRWTPN